MRRPIRQVTSSPRMPTAAPIEPARLEQRERQKLGGERRKQVEAAAVVVEVDERQRALVAEARGVEREQQVAVFGVGVVVPAQAVVAERQKREDAHDPTTRERAGQRRGSSPVLVDEDAATGVARATCVGSGSARSNIWPKLMARFVDGSGFAAQADGPMLVNARQAARLTASQRPMLLSCWSLPRRSGTGPRSVRESRPATTSSPRRTSWRRSPN